MRNMKFWRTALVATLVLTVMLSVTGGTIAWFTDTVESKSNKIEAGTLDIELHQLTAAGWNDISDSTAPLFNSELWEPGRVEYKVLKVENAGTLALKWKTQIVTDAELNKLADVIDVYTKVGVETLPGNREEVATWTKEATLADFIKNAEGKTIGNLAAGAEATLGIALKMREEADNQYQGLSLGSFDIKIVATQDTVEPDSFGKDYDENATYPGEEPKKEWQGFDVVGQDITIDGNEYESADEYVEIAHSSGNLTIKNMTFKNGMTIYTNEVDNQGTVTLENCTIYLNDGTGDPAHATKTQYKKGYGLNLNLVNGSDMTFVFKDCKFVAAEDYVYSGQNSYNVYIGGGYSAESITFDGCEFSGSGKHGIGCSSEDKSQYYKLTVTGCKFFDWNNDPAIANGAAIRGNLPGAEFAADITITGNTFGNNNNSSQSTVAIDSWTGSWN